MKADIKFDEKMLVATANRVLDEYEYNGKTIREWADIISNPKNNADRIRTMNDEDLAYLISLSYQIYPPWCKAKEECPYIDEEDAPCHKCALEWLKQEVEQ